MTSAGKTLTARVTAPILALGGASVKAFDTQIQAEKRLEAALRSAGEEVTNNIADFKDFASELQQLTTVGDESTLKMIQVSKAMGLTNDQAKRAARNSIALSKAMGMSEQSAIRYAAALEQGQVTMLSRYLPGLREIDDMSQRAAKAQELLAQMFSAATAEAENGLGPMRQLWNTIGDISEQIGEIVLRRIQPLIDGLSETADWFKNLDSSIKETIVTVGAMAAAIGPVLIGVGSLVGLLPTLASAFSALAGPVGVAVTAVAGGAAGMVSNWDSVTTYFTTGQGARMWETFQEIIDEAIKAVTKLWEEFGDDIVSVAETSFGLALNIVEQTIDTVLEIMQKFNGDFNTELNIWEDNIFTTVSKIDGKLINSVKWAMGTILSIMSETSSRTYGIFLEPWIDIFDKAGKATEDFNGVLKAGNDITKSVTNYINSLSQGYGVLATEAQLAERAVEKTNEEISKAGEAGKSISSLRSKIDELNKSIEGSFDRTEIAGYQEQIGSLELQIDSLLGKLRTSADIASPTDKLLFDLPSVEELSKGVNLDIPSAYFPPGSMGDLNKRLLSLHEQLMMATDPAIIERLQFQMQMTQDEINQMTGDINGSSLALQQFGQIGGQAFSQLVMEGDKFLDVINNIIKQLGSRAFISGVTSIITGGATGIGGSILKGLGVFHSGGIIPGSGERMILAKGGEGVFTPGQMRAMGSLINNGGRQQGLTKRDLKDGFVAAFRQEIRKLGPKEIFALAHQGKLYY